ncbi:hypothetical protein C1I95_30380, partial [Micromonospora craterilacus]
MESRRPGRLVRVALRFGFLTVVAGVAWAAYDVAVDHPAHAAEAPPVTTPDRPVNPATDLIRAVLAPVVTAVAPGRQSSDTLPPSAGGPAGHPEVSEPSTPTPPPADSHPVDPPAGGTPPAKPAPPP